MGLLEKTLKKSGLERKKPAPPPTAAEERPSVGWLDRSFSERTTALADKIDLESQYARLEAMSQAAPPPPPPKTSLRDRARRFLSGLTGGAHPQPPTADLPVTPAAALPSAERPKMSLRQRATLLMKKITGGGSGSSGAPESDEAGSTASSQGQGHDHRAAELTGDELPEPVFFPWHALSEEGTLQSHVAFGEEPQTDETEVTQAATVATEVTEPVKEEKTPLNEFAETLERITENLKNLHVQLDTGNFIRDVPVTAPGAPAPAISQPPLISHHVPIEETAVLGSGAATSTAGVSVEATGATTRAAPPQPEKARDIFWPKDLPLDLPARDIKLNADGTLSVVPGPFQLPYLAEDIAPPDSDLSHFTRNLKNAELFIAEGELQLTRIIYERLLKKIVDEEAQRKIRANLDALDNYKKSHDWGNFMPLPPWMNQRNPYQDYKPPQLNISEMPVEAKNITINLDKGFFEIAKAIFEQQKEFIQTIAKEKKDDAAAEGKLEEEEEAKAEAAGEEGEESAEAAGEAEESVEERRADEDRRKGAPDTRGEGAPDRRSGRDRRADAEAAAQAPEEAAGDEEAEEEQRAGEDRRKGEADKRGEGAEERRSGGDRREENAPPPPLMADGAAQMTDEAAQTPDGQAAAPEEELPAPQAEPPADGVMEPPKIPEMSPDGQAMAAAEGDEGGEGKEKEEENKVQEIRGVLELKTPDQEDTPFLTLTYDFTKIPHAYRLAKDNGIFEYAYYKYKPMLVKAHQFIKRKQITRALNYYRVIREQQIPNEFRHMVDRNIKDITEYLQKYLVTRQN